MLSPKEEKKLASLEDDMKMPPWKYILIYGVISFGVLFAIITAVIDVLVAGVPVAEIFKRKLWINLALAPVAGVFFGYIYRWLHIKEYHRLKAKEHLP